MNNTISELTTLEICSALRDQAVLQENGIVPKNIAPLLRQAADDLDRNRYHLAMLASCSIDLPEDAKCSAVDNAIEYYNRHNPGCQVTND